MERPVGIKDFDSKSKTVRQIQKKPIAKSPVANRRSTSGVLREETVARVESSSDAVSVCLSFLSSLHLSSLNDHSLFADDSLTQLIPANAGYYQVLLAENPSVKVFRMEFKSKKCSTLSTAIKLNQQ